MGRDTSERLGRLLRVQHGIVARHQAIAVGVSPRVIDGLRARGRWETPLPAVYRDTAAPRTPRQRLWAAVLWAGEGAVLSHSTAARLWELDGIDERVGRPEVLVAVARAPRGAPVTVHRSRRFSDADRTVLDGLAITTPERTLVDLAGVVSDSVLEAAFESARRRGLISLATLAERAVELCGPGRRGGRRVWRVLRLHDGDDRAVESVLEVRALRLLRDSGIALPRVQHEVHLGTQTYRLDFAWPDQRVAVECQGWTFHRSRRRFDLDATRTARLTGAGWRIIPTTWTQLATEPSGFLRAVEATLRDARAARVCAR